MMYVHIVDDGTGVIKCTCWKAPYTDPHLNDLQRISGKFVRNHSLFVYQPFVIDVP